MPADNGVGSEDPLDFAQQLPSEHLTFHSQTSSLIVSKQNAIFAELPIFGLRVLDCLLLLTIQPIGKGDYEQMPRLHQEVHGNGSKAREGGHPGTLFIP